MTSKNTDGHVLWSLIPANIGLHTAWHHAQDGLTWGSLVMNAMLQQGLVTDDDDVYDVLQSVGSRESALAAAAGEGIIAMRTMNKDKEEMLNVVKVCIEFSAFYL